eukprot:scaffold120907_cov38-Prasinocladus_malaysianus.AAC.2
MAQDMSFNEDTNSIWVVAPKKLNEYTVDGMLLKSYTLTNAMDASGIAYVDDNIVAVVSIVWPSLNYYDLTGTASGDVLEPFLTRKITFNGEPFRLNTVTYDPVRDIFFGSSNSMVRTMPSTHSP